MSRLFDGYLMIDWSANSRPKTGRDSIWWCHMARVDGSLSTVGIDNPSTRQQAYRQIAEIAHDYHARQQRVLVGMDYAYGYPQGFAGRLAPGGKALWRSVWRYMHNHIEDGHDNSNNRFAVAAGINQMIADDPAPFWGCPKARQSRYLSMRQPRGNLNSLFPEFRLAEQGNASHSVWKLMYAGSVGSQVMMGLPYLYRLITDKALAKASKVWPFETGLKSIHEQDLSGVHIVHAEIYPSLFEVKPAANMVKDELQVRQLAQYFAEQDKKGTLGQLFAGRRTLMNEQRQIVEREEGWILGI